MWVQRSTKHHDKDDISASLHEFTFLFLFLFVGCFVGVTGQFNSQCNGIF